ncbi:MAG: glycosyltransferase family 4 protein [Terriglobales bacterium]
MKVLILATDVFTRGGIARYTFTLASSLGRILGAENVDVLSFFDWGYSGEQPCGFRLVGTVSGKTRAGALSRLHFLSKAATAGFRGYDLVITNHIALAPIAAMMKRVFGIPYWVACHSVEIWWGTSRWRHGALKNAELILPVSQYTGEVVRKMKGVQNSRVTVLYNAIPDSFAKLLAPEGPLEPTNVPTAKVGKDGPMVLSVCALVRGNEFKGVDTVIRALPRVLEDVPKLRYLVVGDGGIRGKLEALASATGVAGNVTFTGEIPDAELAELYRCCDVFALPSRGQEVRGVVGGEGFGRVYVEAALAGKPVVGSRSGGASEAVLHGRTGFVVNPDSRDEVAEALLTLLQYPELAVRMGSAGRAWALDTFSEDALASSLGELLRPHGFKSEVVQELVEVGERI